MATTSNSNPDQSVSPQSETETQPSSNAEQGSMFLSFDEAVKVLPMCLQSNDEREQHHLFLFLSQVDQLHNPDYPRYSGDAFLILRYIRAILECAPEIGEVASSQQGTLTRSEAFARLPKLCIAPSFEDITGEIATEIASKVADDVDSHNITMSLLEMLQQYRWEVKVALTVTTFILTFGNNGLNLCPQSKVSLNNSPMIVKQLLEITSCFVEFERYSYSLMKWKEPKVKEVRTYYVVAAYWTVRAVVENAAFYINTISSSGYKFGSAISPPSDEKLEVVSIHLQTMLQQFHDYFYVMDTDLKEWKREEDETMLRVWFHLPDHTPQDIRIRHVEEVDGTRILQVYPSGPRYGIVKVPGNATVNMEEIRAEFNINKALLCISVPKRTSPTYTDIPIKSVSHDL